MFNYAELSISFIFAAFKLNIRKNIKSFFKNKVIMAYAINQRKSSQKVCQSCQN
jgi:hypothetical protein